MRPRIAPLAAALLVLAAGSTLTSNVTLQAKDDKPEIKIVIEAPVKQGMAPLPVKFVATVIAPNELNEEIYSATFEWKIMGRFVLTDRLTGGNSVPLEMRDDFVDPYERSLRNTKHLVGRSRIRSPREPYTPEKEVKRVFEFEYEFLKAGEYFVTFRMVKPKASSREYRVIVKGDTSYDPFRGR